MLRRVLLGIMMMMVALAYAAEPMERAQDTEKTWEAQAEEVAEASSAAPVFSGMLVWSGRADRNYKPFFQWEMRLAGGLEAIADLRVRIQPLAPDFSPLQAGRIGEWEKLGDLAPGEEVDLSYKINTPIFTAYRVELAWSGGAASYLATDRIMLPRLENGDDSAPQLVVLEPIWERNPRGKTMVGFWLRNQGSMAAEGVTLTLRLRDGDGKVLLEHPYVPEDGTIAGGYAKEQRVLIEKTPPFHNIQIGISSKEVTTLTLEEGSLGTGSTVEVGAMRAVDGVLHGKLRNGTADRLLEVLITVSFVGEGGVAIAEKTVTVDVAEANAVVDWQLPVADLPAWTGYETSLAYGIDDGTGAGDGASPAAPQEVKVTVEGLTLTILNSQGAAGVLKLSGELHNHSGADLAALELTLTVAGAKQEVVMAVGDLAEDERITLSLLAEGVEQLTGLALSWRSGVKTP